MYEFTESENEIIMKLSNRITFFAIILISIALFDFISQLLRGSPVVEIISIPFILSIMGVSLFFPARNFRNVAKTEGNDVKELITGFKRLSSGLNFVILPMLILPVIILYNTYFN